MKDFRFEHVFFGIYHSMPNRININIDEMGKFLDEGLSVDQIAKLFKVSPDLIRNRIKVNNLQSRYIYKRRPFFSKEVRYKISRKRKDYLRENPDKHVWKRSCKFKSTPCEKVKAYLKELGVYFIEEYSPNLEGRNFSIDIAFPDKMIALEINGNQHYNSDGTLKPYYQEREEVLIRGGWTVYQIPSKSCFNQGKWGEFIDKIEKSESKIEFDYFNYTPRKTTRKVCDCGKIANYNRKKCPDCISIKRIKRNNYSTKPQKVKRNDHFTKPPRAKRNAKKCVDCSKSISKASTRCKRCAGKIFSPKKVENRPDKNRLHYLLWAIPTQEIGKLYGVSDNAIAKWSRILGLTKPPRGYWRLLETNKIIDYQI